MSHLRLTLAVSRSGTSDTEPFGQTVSPTDPYYDPPEPPMSGPGAYGGAGDMEWQCQAPQEFYGGFSGLPFHCQKRILMDLSRGLDEIFGFRNPHNPNIPNQVTTYYIGGNDSPLETPSIPGADAPAGKSGTNLTLAAMLQPTAKPDDKKPKTVPEPNIPDPCSWDKDGTPDCSVTIKDTGPTMPVDLERFNAENQIIDERRMTENELNGLRTNLEKLMDDSDCSKFIEKLISNLPDSNSVQVGNRELISKKFSGDLIANFDRMRKDYGFWIGTMNEAYAAITNLRGITFNEMKFNRGESHGWPGGFRLKSVDLNGQQNNTFTLVHELIHIHYLPPDGQKGALTADHNVMAIAAQKALVDAGIIKDPIPIKGSEAYYFNDALVLACGKVKL